MSLALKLVLALTSLHLCAATCTDFPIRLPGKTLELPLSDSRTPTCPSEGEKQAALDQLDSDLDDLISAQLPTLQQLSSPAECPGGGWIKVADFDLERDDATTSTPTTANTCPGGWEKFVTQGIPHCRLRDGGGLCQSTNFSTNAVLFSQVCGRVRGYQVGRTTGFFASGVYDPDLTLDDPYLDGVSITRGRRPREHIWSFASGTSTTITSTTTIGHACPCLNPEVAAELSLPDYVGDNYFCNSGTDEPSYFWEFYPNPLWGGQGCAPGNKCCDGGAYFFVDLKEPSCDPLEVRLCTSVLEFAKINVGVSAIELYVK